MRREILKLHCGVDFAQQGDVENFETARFQQICLEVVGDRVLHPVVVLVLEGVVEGKNEYAAFEFGGEELLHRSREHKNGECD